jgi:hypothetical protein
VPRSLACPTISVSGARSASAPARS